MISTSIINNTCRILQSTYGYGIIWIFCLMSLNILTHSNSVFIVWHRFGLLITPQLRKHLLHPTTPGFSRCAKDWQQFLFRGKWIVLITFISTEYLSRHLARIIGLGKTQFNSIKESLVFVCFSLPLLQLQWESDWCELITFFCTWRIGDYLQVALKLSSQDLVSGISKHGGYVAEILLLLMFRHFHSRHGAHILTLGHLHSGVIQEYILKIKIHLQIAEVHTHAYITSPALPTICAEDIQMCIYRHLQLYSPPCPQPVQQPGRLSEPATCLWTGIQKIAFIRYVILQSAHVETAAFHPQNCREKSENNNHD